MPSAHIVRETNIVRTPRTMQLEGIFQIPPSATQVLEWQHDLPYEDRDWNIGLIVGPSGSGKSVLAHELYGKQPEYEWHPNASVIDGMPQDMPIKDISALLSSVGFSSPPSWLKPFGVLSNGEQFRVTMARALADRRDITVIDEFTSVVDRQVAQVGSVAVAKTVRMLNTKFVAVSCHYDIIEWLQPDWIYEPAIEQFRWRSLQRHPRIDIEIRRVDRKAWRIFQRHHYLDTSIATSAQCFVGFVLDQPAVFTAVLPFPHARRSGWREHRTVCLPDFQGVGIGNAMSDFVAGMFRAKRKPYFSVTANPAMVYHRAKSNRWRMTRPPSRTAKIGKTSSIKGLAASAATDRFTAGFEYVGPSLPDEARRLGVII